MLLKKRYKKRYPRYAQIEHQEQHKMQINKFIDLKNSFLEKEVESFVLNQAERLDESIKLLQFKPKITFADSNQSNNQESMQLNHMKTTEKEIQEEINIKSKIIKIQKQIELFEILKSYVQQKLMINDSEVSQNEQETSSDEIYETRKNLLNGQFKNIENMFYLNYFPNIDPHQQAQVSAEQEWFIIDEDLNKYTSSISYFQNLRYNNYLFNKSLKMFIQPSVTTIEEYEIYNDYVQTSIIRFNSPISVIINFSLDQPLQLIATLKCLLCIKSYNIIQININCNNYEQQFCKLVEQIFRVAFGQRCLQQITINITTDRIYFLEILDNLSKAMSQCDLEKSVIRVFKFSQLNSYSYDIAQIGVLNEFFYQISRLKMIYHFSIQNVPVFNENLENFYKITSQATSAQLYNIITELNFNSQTLQFLDLNYSFMSTKEEYVKCENFKNATNLRHLNVQCYTHIQYFQPTRKEILQQGQRKNILSSDQNQKKETEQKEDTPYTQEYQQKEQEECQNKILPYQLDNLIAITQLQVLNIQISKEQSVLDSFIEFMRKSQNLKQVQIRSSGINQDLSQLFQIIDCYKSLRSFYFQCYDSKYIKYQKEQYQSDYYSLETNCIPNSFCLLNPYKLILHNEVGSTNFMQSIDEICQSVKKSTKIKQVNFELRCQVYQSQIARYETKDYQLKLFFHLIDLKELENLKVNCFFNQQLINNLSNFIENSQSLRGLVITRNPYKQLYLDFSSLFKSISLSQTIENIQISLGIESQKVKLPYQERWLQTKIKNFYQPLCEMLQQSNSNLLLIKLEEGFCQQGANLLLNSILNLKQNKYIMINQIMTHIQSLKKGEDDHLKQLFYEAYQKGYLVYSSQPFEILNKF